MPYGSVYVPTRAPIHLEQGGLLGMIQTEPLPALSQTPEAFVPAVVFRALRISHSRAQYLSYLGYDQHEAGVSWSKDLLRLLWEASFAGYRLDLEVYARAARVRAISVGASREAKKHK